MYFHRLPTKMRLFSSILFRRSIFVSRPSNIYIFDGFLAIFNGFWPIKLSYFLFFSCSVRRWQALQQLAKRDRLPPGNLQA
jgi:hypothetical protein